MQERQGTHWTWVRITIHTQPLQRTLPTTPPTWTPAQVLLSLCRQGCAAIPGPTVTTAMQQPQRGPRPVDINIVCSGVGFAHTHSVRRAVAPRATIQDEDGSDNGETTPDIMMAFNGTANGTATAPSLSTPPPPPPASDLSRSAPAAPAGQAEFEDVTLSRVRGSIAKSDAAVTASLSRRMADTIQRAREEGPADPGLANAIQRDSLRQLGRGSVAAVEMDPAGGLRRSRPHRLSILTTFAL